MSSYYCGMCRSIVIHNADPRDAELANLRAELDARTKERDHWRAQLGTTRDAEVWKLAFEECKANETTARLQLADALAREAALRAELEKVSYACPFECDYEGRHPACTLHNALSSAPPPLESEQERSDRCHAEFEVRCERAFFPPPPQTALAATLGKVRAKLSEIVEACHPCNKGASFAMIAGRSHDLAREALALLACEAAIRALLEE